LNENFNNIIDKKNIKIEASNFLNNLNNSNEKDYKIINQINKTNNLNSTNMVSYDSNICIINSNKYIDDENNKSFQINEQSKEIEFNKSINSYKLFNYNKDHENKINENVCKLENNNNNNALFDLEENLNKNEFLNSYDLKFNLFNSKLFLELNQIDNENNNFNSNQKIDENIEKLKNILNLNL